MKDFLASIASRGAPVADIEQGYMSAAACILANLSMRLGRSLQWGHAKRRGRQRSGSESASAPALSFAVGAPGPGGGARLTDDNPPRAARVQAAFFSSL
jgi:hypothetical protein